MTVEELVNLIVTEEVALWDYSKEDYINSGNPLNKTELDKMILECEVLSIECQDNNIVVNIDTSNGLE